MSKELYNHKNFKLQYFEDATRVGRYGLPQLASTQFIPDKVISFNERKNIKDPEDYWIDFFINDYYFESFWNAPGRSLNNLRKFKGIITPDYSMIPAMLPGQIIWNCTRNRVMAYYLQRKGFNIIPVASWCGVDGFDWCFDGLPEKSSIAISNNGCLSSPYSRRIFLKGVEELQKRKQPSHLIVCGRFMEELSLYNNIIYYPSKSQRMKEHIKNGQ